MSFVPILPIIFSNTSDHILTVNDFNPPYVFMSSNGGTGAFIIPPGLANDLFNSLPPPFRIPGYSFEWSIIAADAGGSSLSLINNDPNIDSSRSKFAAISPNMGNYISLWILTNKSPAQWIIFDRSVA